MGKHIPLPADPTERKAEQLRRRTACVKAWRRKQARRLAALERAAYELDALERLHGDLIGL
jgi:hypothetical protein